MPRGNSRFKRLFEPGFIGSLEVKNRLVMAPMGTRLPNELGGVTEPQIDYYVERAKGGVGLIISEATCIDYPLGLTGPTSPTIHDNAYIGGHNELVEAVHRCSAKIVCQLVHAGRETKPVTIKGLKPVAPSPVPCKILNVTPRELTISEIEDIVKKFIEAAVRAKTAGYDGVELHGAHGYLIAQFMSAYTNHRDDRYGGKLRERMTFPLEIIKGIKKKLGPNFPVIFRISADEFVDGGIKLEESKTIAKILEETGIDAIHVSAGTYESMHAAVEPMSYPEAWKIYMAEAIKRVLEIPVIGVGVIRSPETAEKILKQKKVDFIALGRTLLADPNWPQKVKERREKEIIPCISCNIGCIGRTQQTLHIRCAVNPFTGQEHLKRAFQPKVEKKRVFVIGGGTAGMVAALTAKKRGHQVTLYEKSNQLGGQLCLAAKPPGKEKIGWFNDYLRNQIKQERVKVILNQTVTKQMIFRQNPDALIVATGAVPLIPNIPGIKRRFVHSGWEILEGKKKINNKVVMVAGGGTVGCETALFLAPNNKKVIIVEMMNDIALDMEPISRSDLISKIQEAKIEVLLRKKIEGIERDGFILLTYEQNQERLRVDIVVLALGATPLNILSKELSTKVKKIYIVGDCYRPRRIMDAVHEGFQAAISL